MRADVERPGSVGLDSAELRASLLLLYQEGREEAALYELNGKLFLRTAEELIAAGYPGPGGQRYLCLGFEPFEVARFAGEDVAAVARRGRERKLWAAPKAMTWAELQFALSQ